MFGYVAGRRTVDKHSAVVAEARDVFFGVLDRLRLCGRFLYRSGSLCILGNRAQ